MKQTSKLTIVIILFSVLSISCGDDDKSNLPDPGDPPVIPGEATFVMDFSDFQQANGRLDANLAWLNAAGRVVVWNVLIGFTFAIPVAAFRATVSQTPTYDFDRQLWVWTFSYDLVGKEYSAELTGQLEDDEVNWEMYISVEAGFQDFLWYSGTSKIDGSSGNWELNKSPEESQRWLSIDWEMENENIGRITYTDVSGMESDGGFIEYGRRQGTDYDTYYTISNAVNGNLVQIEWNRDANNGRIKDPLGFGDDAYRCWNENFEDIDCPQ